jgi:hypothetical protein
MTTDMTLYHDENVPDVILIHTIIMTLIGNSKISVKQLKGVMHVVIVAALLNYKL